MGGLGGSGAALDARQGAASGDDGDGVRSRAAGVAQTPRDKTETDVGVDFGTGGGGSSQRHFGTVRSEQCRVASPRGARAFGDADDGA